MATSDESFLPQIVGLFYAAFDPKYGPTVLHQVPENLITSTSKSEDFRSPSTSRSPDPRSRSFPHTSTRSLSPSDPTLLDFAPLSDYVIPKKSLYGKLVNLLTTGNDANTDEKVEYRIMGFPSLLTGENGRYQRNEYMWNLCFVFHASSSLEAFEPVVRKCGRILRSAELDSGYLSYPQPNHTPLHSVLEQLFEDLNSYSETSIPLDGFNSLELKLFPFFPNPPDCEDWHVPVALVDLNSFKDDNWDITASRVSAHIDGVNHVKRIAELADADLALTRETLRHMLFYQVVMMVDIFQYSNMYTLKPSITRLASDETVIHECAPYVTRPSFPHSSWPTLLKLYARLLPGVTVHDWVETNDILSLGIDPRRFVSFGIIKGFLRRVHRWPILLEKRSPVVGPRSERKVEFEKSARQPSSLTLSHQSGKAGQSSLTLRSMGSNASLGASPSKTPSSMTKSPGRRPHGFMVVKGSVPPSVNSHGEINASAASRRSGTMRSGALRIKEHTRGLNDEISRYLDGTHHSDEIQVRFGLGWPDLARAIGAESEDVAVVYR